MLISLYSHPDGGGISIDTAPPCLVIHDENETSIVLPIGWHGLARLGQDCQELAKMLIQAQQRGDAEHSA